MTRDDALTLGQLLGRLTQQADEGFVLIRRGTRAPDYGEWRVSIRKDGRQPTSRGLTLEAALAHAAARFGPIANSLKEP